MHVVCSLTTFQVQEDDLIIDRVAADTHVPPEMCGEFGPIFTITSAFEVTCLFAIWAHDCSKVHGYEAG